MTRDLKKEERKIEMTALMLSHSKECEKSEADNTNASGTQALTLCGEIGRKNLDECASRPHI